MGVEEMNIDLGLPTDFPICITILKAQYLSLQVGPRKTKSCSSDFLDPAADLFFRLFN